MPLGSITKETLDHLARLSFLMWNVCDAFFAMLQHSITHTATGISRISTIYDGSGCPSAQDVLLTFWEGLKWRSEVSNLIPNQPLAHLTWSYLHWQ